MSLPFSRWALGVLAASLAWVAWCQAPLAQDGSVFCLSALNELSPVLPMGRWLWAPFEWPAILLARVGGELGPALVAWNLAYASMPLLALLLCARLSSPKDDGFAIWPAVWLGLASASSQFNLVSEAVAVLNLAWSLLALALLGCSRRSVGLGLALAVFLAGGHPVAALASGLAAAALLARWHREGRSESGLLLLAAGLALLAGGMLTRVVLWPSEWETQRAAEVLRLAEVRSPDPSVLLAIAVSGLLAAGLLLGPLAERWPERFEPFASSRFRAPVLLGSAVGAGAMLALRLDAQALASAPAHLKYLNPVLFLPLAVASAADVLLRPSLATLRPERERSLRRRLSSALLLALALLLGLQARAWALSRIDIDAVLQLVEVPCVSARTLGNDHPLAYWSGALSLLSQGRQPDRFMLPGLQCRTQDFRGGIEVTPWARARFGGWFDFSRLRARLAPKLTSRRPGPSDPLSPSGRADRRTPPPE